MEDAGWRKHRADSEIGLTSKYDRARYHRNELGGERSIHPAKNYWQQQATTADLLQCRAHT